MKQLRMVRKKNSTSTVGGAETAAAAGERAGAPRLEAAMRRNLIEKRRANGGALGSTTEI